MNEILNHSARKFFAISMIGLAVSTAGCLSIGGSPKTEHPTLGRQLQDLKMARDHGAINDMEYQQAKMRLLSDAR